MTAVFKWAMLLLLAVTVNGRAFGPEDDRNMTTLNLEDNALDDATEIHFNKHFFIVKKPRNSENLRSFYSWQERPAVIEKRMNGRGRFEQLLNYLAENSRDRRSLWKKPGHLM